MELPQSRRNLGRLDGVMEHAERTALMLADNEVAEEAVNLMWHDAAQMLIDKSITDKSKQERLKLYANGKLKKTIRRVMHVEKGTFTPEEGTEYDSDFAAAAEELLVFYSSDYFGHKNQEIIRWCVANRILEVSDDEFKLCKTIESAQKLEGILRGPNDDGSFYTEEEYIEALNKIINYKQEEG